MGAGNILLSGNGAISALEIFNTPAGGGKALPMTFFALYSKEEGAEPVTKILEGKYPDEFTGAFGTEYQHQGGLPRFANASFYNEYPAVRIALYDEEVPLDARLTAWSPFNPVDPAGSSLPAAVFEWELTNPGKKAVEYSLAFSIANPVYSIDAAGQETKMGCKIKPGHTVAWNHVTFDSPVSNVNLPGTGSFRVSFPSEVHPAAPVSPGRCGVDARLFWDDLSDDGQIASELDTVYTDDGSGMSVQMTVSGRLEPGSSKSIPFLFTWYIPYREIEAGIVSGIHGPKNKVIRNYYTVGYGNINEISTRVYQRMDELRSKTFSFSDAMLISTVYPQVLDAAISNLAVLKTNLLFRDESGMLYGFEGLGDDKGVGKLNEASAWNNGYSLRYLFPQLERNIRENQAENVTPEGLSGTIMRIYADWKLTGDNAWLGTVWPDIKNSLEFIWNGPVPSVDGSIWDPGRSGVLDGKRNTGYNIMFDNPELATGSYYLGALKAVSEMATAMNEPQFAMELKEIYLSGKRRYSERLWNGAYYQQQNSTENSQLLDIYQIGEGCFSGQLSGQALAFTSGLDYLLDTLEVRNALGSIYRNNFREDLGTVENTGRVFGASGEAGLILCAWPNDTHPVLPFPYSNEVWTGIEYQVAAAMFYTGYYDEPLRIVEAARSRYNGVNRNPFAELLNGRFSVNSLASWAVYQSMSGYSYDGGSQAMYFKPVTDALPYRFVWTTATAWGTLNIDRAGMQLKCEHGSLDLNLLSLKNKKLFVFREFQSFPAADISFENESLQIRFDQPLRLDEGQMFRMEIP